MKKLLLLSALSFCAIASNAEYTDYYKVYFAGNELNNGDEIYCSIYETDPSNTLRYEADIKVVSQNEFNVFLKADLVNAPGSENGTPSLCFSTTGEIFQGGQWVTFPDNNCFPSLPNVCTLYPEILPFSGVESNFEWQAESLYTAPDMPAKMILTFCAGEDLGGEPSLSDFEEIEGTDFEVTIVFTTDFAGVNTIGTENADIPVYYNIQGVRVAEPANGIYIVKRGNKTTKEIIRK